MARPEIGNTFILCMHSKFYFVDDIRHSKYLLGIAYKQHSRIAKYLLIFLQISQIVVSGSSMYPKDNNNT